MFGLGVFEVVLVIGLLIFFFGGRKIPELARGLGAGIRNFKRGMRGAEEEEEDDDERRVGPGEEPPDRS